MMRVQILTLLTTFLISCSNTTVVSVDPALALPCDKSQLEGKKWKDVAVLAIKRGQNIDDCNDRLRAIRESAK